MKDNGNKIEEMDLLYHRKEFYLDYSGDFKNNRKHGKDTRYYANGNIFYEGLYADNKGMAKGQNFTNQVVTMCNIEKECYMDP